MHNVLRPLSSWSKSDALDLRSASVGKISAVREENSTLTLSQRLRLRVVLDVALCARSGSRPWAAGDGLLNSDSVPLLGLRPASGQGGGGALRTLCRLALCECGLVLDDV